MSVHFLPLPVDIKDGNLKAILGLFFSLSRFKQQQKSAQQQVQHNINQNTVTPTSDSGRSSTGSASNANANTEMLSRSVRPGEKAVGGVAAISLWFIYVIY